MKIIKKYKNIDDCYLFDSEIKWPVVTIFSWIHWDEVSGIKSNKKLLENILNNNILLISWKLILVLKANQNAIKLWKRQEKINLNRLFAENIEYWDSYEEKRAQELKLILKETEYFLDLHSTPWPTKAYFFSEEKSLELALQLGVEYIVLWWSKLDSKSIAWDTENYVNNNWWIALTLEAGSHQEINREQNAYQTSLNFLSTLWIISQEFYSKLSKKTNIIRMTWVYICKTWNFRFTLKNLNNFSFLKKWEIIGFDWDERIEAIEDMILVMPNLVNPWIWIDVFFVWENYKKPEILKILDL